MGHKKKNVQAMNHSSRPQTFQENISSYDGIKGHIREQIRYMDVETRKEILGYIQKCNFVFRDMMHKWNFSSKLIAYGFPSGEGLDFVQIVEADVG